MKRNYCLIAGPVTLDEAHGQTNLLGGAGFYAAAAAGPSAHPQLWARVGDDFGSDLMRILTARHIETGGLDVSGETLRTQEDGTRSAGQALGESEPVSAVDLTCALVIDLDVTETRRALAALKALGDSTSRTLVVAPSVDACRQDPDLINECAAASSLLILKAEAAQEVTGTDDPLTAIKALQERGATSIALTAGIYGGIAAYKNKTCSWSTNPIQPKDPTGMSAVFVGALVGSLAESGKCDWRALKRGLSLGSAVAAASGQGIGPKKLLSLNRNDYTDLFNRMRRNNKF